MISLDGYKSLLVQSEGGEAEEIVSEENGILISMLLRQYFLSLKVLRRWTKLEPSMGRHWNRVHKDLQPHCPLLEPNSRYPMEQKQTSNAVMKNANESNSALGVPESSKREKQDQQGKAQNSYLSDTNNCSRCRSQDRNLKRNQKRRQQQQQLGQDDDSSADSESDDDTNLTQVKPVSAAVEQHDRELVIIRRVMRKWRRLSGLNDDPCACDGLGEGEFTASWTRVSVMVLWLFSVQYLYYCTVLVFLQ